MPDLTADTGAPVYRRVAEGLAGEIAAGRLAPGDRLPPQRDLARQLSVGITTVTKAYLELQRRCLVETRAGGGTIVRAETAPDQPGGQDPAERDRLIDLTINRPATNRATLALAETLATLSRDRRFADVADYHPSAGPAWARQAAAAWIGSSGHRPDADGLLVTAGAQHALNCIFAAVLRRGDVILCDLLTYQGLKALCRQAGVTVQGVATDAHGMLPDALEAAIAEHEPRALFLVPSLHNPTTVTIPEDRRHALVTVARRHGLILIEDDVYGPLLESRPTPFFALYPEATWSIAGTSKCLAPGLRLGFLLPPAEFVATAARAVQVNCWTVSPLPELVFAQWMENGLADEILVAQRVELAARQAIAGEALRGLEVWSDPHSTHLWLVLPEPWRADDLVRTAHAEGIAVLSAEAFAVGRAAAPHAVRINVAAARSRDDLRRALNRLAALLQDDETAQHNAI